MSDKTTKSYALSKTKVVEMIEAKFGTSGQVDVSAVIALFGKATGGSTGSTTLVYGEDGAVIAKRCSYFGVFFAISEFGLRGDTYSYQSKLAESLVRKARTAATNAKKLADEELENEEITVTEWKMKLKEIAEMGEARVSIYALDDTPEHYETVEAAKLAL